ncbi:adenine-specific methyltransferase [Staphylococcus phage vB_SauM-V1SA22]|nr:adenine-specific methyltransferase [Staphylococcus phage vB_SauM-V1SA22]
MIKLLQGDCLELLDTVEDSSIDAIVTDPPYNIAKENRFTTIGRAGIDFGEWDKNFEPTLWVNKTIPKVKKGGNIVVFCDMRQFTPIIDTMEALGCEFKDVIRMEKSNPMPRNRDRRFIFDTEFALYFVKKGAKWTFNRLDEKYERPCIKTSVTPRSEKQGKGHPTQKPLYAMEWLLERLTNEGDIVLNCFMGSGTTGVACKKLNRNFIGCELSEEYFSMAQDRLLNNTN